MTRKTISRKTKGAVAAVAGGALLVASGGTFAYWLDTAQLEGSTITAGELGLNASMTDAEYTIDGGTTWTDLPDDYLMTPGHLARFEFEVTSVVKGTALEARLDVGPARLDSETIPSTVILWQVSTNGGADWSITREGEVSVLLDGNSVNDEQYLFRVTLEFPWGTGDNAGNSFGHADPYQWTLEDMQIVLTQTKPNPTTP